MSVAGWTRSCVPAHPASDSRDVEGPALRRRIGVDIRRPTTSRPPSRRSRASVGTMASIAEHQSASLSATLGRLPAPAGRLEASRRDLADQGARRRSTSRSRPRRSAWRSPSRSWRTTTCRSRTPRKVDEFMRDKFTNQELYDWMVGQIAGIYFQSYQLAYDVAKRAERAYRYELGLQRLELHPVRLLGQPEEGAAGRRAAAPRPQADGGGLPRPEPARVRDHQARLARCSSTRSRCSSCKADRRVLSSAAGGAVRPRLSRATTCAGSSRQPDASRA